jgi:hypothetical protein
MWGDGSEREMTIGSTVDYVPVRRFTAASSASPFVTSTGLWLAGGCSYTAGCPFVQILATLGW